ncbi:uncharacterized protein [Garra rufa]|uniref:uncharacterized protein n=1 Tax=Garra rufa TaxID=137080 RepID=UPI003CCED870
MDWPTCSPDLNPLEHIWDIMSRSIHQHHVAPQTVRELADALVQVWEEIPQETIRHLIRSMARCCPIKLCDKPPDVETATEEESEGKVEKGKKKSYKSIRASPVKKGDKQEIRKWKFYETQLPVTCGNKEGTLYRDKLLRGEKCIFSQGRSFTPSDFEKFGGKERWKNWKLSIRCEKKTPLKKLIEDGYLECPQKKRRKKTFVQKNINKQFCISSNKSSSKDSETNFSLVEESDPKHFQEHGGRGGETEIRGRVEEEEEEEEEDMADLSVFEAPSLPVTCVSLTGTLYKYRFASGSRGKCIRTEERWFTPEEFVKQEQTLTGGHWKKYILCHGKTLNFLNKKEILLIHSLLCECVNCSTEEEDVMDQNNDDECYVCRSEKDLVCCDECPRAFHSDCHLPAVDEDSPGEWICTYCVLRNSQQWRDPINMSEQEAFNAPVSQYILHCRYLLLCVYRDIQKVFVEDPRKMEPKYSKFITQPMWLDKIKQKLESGAYQMVGAFVSDCQLIFRNYSRDNEFGRMGARLKAMFEEEFQKIFSITSSVKKGDEQEIWIWPIYKTQLPVTCGDKEGTLYRDKLPGGGKCILSKGHWFTPDDFEKFGGKERCKNWKSSIRCRNTPLKKLIEEGHLQCPPIVRKKRTCVQKNMNEQFPVSSSESSSEDSDFSLVEESDPEDFQGGRGGGTEFRGRVEEEEEEDMADLSVFQAPSLAVTCVSLTGTLYKDRFKSGWRGKCIRTEERWFTPEEFVKQEPTLTDGHWNKDILCHGKTLNYLLEKEILRIHYLLCKCVKCRTQKDMMDQNNDDECFMCDSEEDLVCCDQCPRAFHSLCHIPAVDGDSPGQWMCTFCMLKNSQQQHGPSNMSEQEEAFNAPVSQYILHCRYLLLCVYREDIQRVFVKDPRKTVRRYSEFITQPMWLDKIKQKLESGTYQTVGAFFSDFQLIFSNCRKFNGDNKFGQMGARLKKMFEEEFQKIFSISIQ